MFSPPARLVTAWSIADSEAARIAVRQGDSVQEEHRGERTEQEVLERCFLAQQPATAGEPAQDVQRQ
ncbi:hypothetical protein [Aeromicrobium sp. UC242_57]|uniref:hypothetical protein n=1 Tax=Aeromicrobium sp. UC242_57 TaxID=3374624 RepID=UPI0037B41EF2